MHEDRDEWIQWATYNLALGLSEADVKSEMVKNGFTIDQANETLQSTCGGAAYKAALQLAQKYKQMCVLNEALLELESQVHDFSAVKRLSRLSSNDFHEHYFCTNRPVIIEDVVTDWPAVSKWDIDFFRRKFGGEQVVYQGGRSIRDHRDAFVDHSVKASFSEFLDIIERPPSGASPAYLIAHDRLLDKASFKPLLEDITFDSRYFDNQDTHGRVFFWLGSAGSATPMHRDLGNVYLAQIKGRKLIRMTPSKQLHLMYNEVGYHSDADFDNLSLDDFPRLKDAFITEFIVNPGDLLFIPVGWWHFVKCLDTSITVTGNNFCFPNRLRPIF